MKDLTQPRSPKTRHDAAAPVESVVGPDVKLEHPRCPFCHEAVRSDDVKAACDACMAWQHEDCWIENQSRCSTCGHQEAIGRIELTARIALTPPKTDEMCGHVRCEDARLEGLDWCERHSRLHVKLTAIVTSVISLSVLALYGWLWLAGVELAWAVALFLLPVFSLLPSMLETRRRLLAFEVATKQDGASSVRAQEGTVAGIEGDAEPSEPESRGLAEQPKPRSTPLGRIFGG